MTAEQMRQMSERVARTRSEVASLLADVRHFQASHPEAQVHQYIGLGQISTSLESASRAMEDADIRASVLYLSTL